jgi:hypothetical protein
LTESPFQILGREARSEFSEPASLLEVGEYSEHGAMQLQAFASRLKVTLDVESGFVGQLGGFRGSPGDDDQDSIRGAQGAARTGHDPAQMAQACGGEIRVVGTEKGPTRRSRRRWSGELA